MTELTDNAPMPYDKREGHPIMVSMGESITFAGTVTSAAGIASTYMRIPFACKLVGATTAQEVGATAAGPTIHIDRSVGGTGTFAALATHAFGTVASTAGEDITVTTTDIAADDVLRLEVQVGTTASSERLGRVMLELVTEAI